MSSTNMRPSAAANAAIANSFRKLLASGELLYCITCDQWIMSRELSEHEEHATTSDVTIHECGHSVAAPESDD